MLTDQQGQARIIRASIRIIQSRRATAEGDIARATARLERLDAELAKERAALEEVERTIAAAEPQKA